MKGLTPEQRKVAVVADKAPREVTAVATPQPPQTPAEGITAADLTAEQQQLLFKLIDVYIDAVPEEVAAERRAAVDQAGAMRFDLPGQVPWNRASVITTGSRAPPSGSNSSTLSPM